MLEAPSTHECMAEVCRAVNVEQWGRSIVKILAALTIWIQLFTPHAALAQAPKRVMLLHSFGREFKPWSDYARYIRTELERQSPWPLDVTDHSLVSARSSDDDPEAPFVEYLRALFAKRPLDLIISIGAPATAFVQRHRQDLFINTPMVLTAIDQRRVQYSQLTDNDTVVPVRIDYLKAMENILHVLPATKNIINVVGTSPIEKFWKDAIVTEVEPLASRVTFSWTDHLPFDEFLKQASSLPPDFAIFWELMIVDAAGVVHEGSAPLTRLHAVASAPIFSYDESFFGDGILGGPLLLVADSSKQTVAAAVRILGGANPQDIKIPPIEFGVPRFDWREMQRWNIDEQRLPPGSEVHFKASSMWDSYRAEIFATFSILLVQSALILGLIYEHRRRAGAEAIARRSMSELAHMNRIATAGQLSASIAHEVSQPLTGIINAAGAIRHWLAAENPDLSKVRAAVGQIELAGDRAGDIVRSVRSMFKHEAREPTDVNINALILLVVGLLKSELQQNEIELVLRLDDALPSVLGDPIQLQQVIVNLVMNAIESMHAVAFRRLSITSKKGDDHKIEIYIEDTGVGIDPNDIKKLFEPMFTSKENGIGMGLAICRSIIENHDGKISVARSSGHGAVFQVDLPCKVSPRHEVTPD